MKKLMHILVLSCQKATFLAEKGMNKRLSFMDKLQLSMHLKMCRKCSRYQKQSVLIEMVLKSNHKHLSNADDFKLSDRSKLRMQKVIDAELK